MNHFISHRRTILEVTSANIWNALSKITQKGIPVYQIVEKDTLTIQIEVYSHHYPAILKTLQNNGDLIKIQRFPPVQKILQRITAHPVFVFGFCLWAAIMILLPQRIFIIDVQGNSIVPTRRILEASENCGLHFGTPRNSIRSEKIKNQLLAEIPALQWAGVNTYGCRAVISVQEKNIDDPQKSSQNVVSSIVASKDGIINSLSIQNGTALCKIGDSVVNGQLLVSGYTSCERSIRAERAEGEIYAYTISKFKAATPTIYLQRDIDTVSKHIISLIIGKKRINLWKDSGISDSTCGRIGKEYRLTLPGGFHLPLVLCCDVVTVSDVSNTAISSQRIKSMLQTSAEQYLTGRMVAGEIQSSEISFDSIPGGIRLNGIYKNLEMIGREHFEKMGDLYGKNS